MSSIYIHIPFCKQACHYCDFHFSTSLKHKEDLIHALCKELIWRKKEIDQPIECIYFGGGTPSILSYHELEKIIETIHQHYNISDHPEITLEANPDDITDTKLKDFKAIGINRLSLGIQSFFEKDLKLMNRAHNQSQAFDSIKRIKKYFDNYSIDLIYGIPEMEEKRWKQNLEIALDFDVPHLSCYALTVEPDTALAHFINKDIIAPVDDELAANHFNILYNLLTLKGYQHYEFSNFGKKGYFSQNNQGYWTGKPYIGIGPSAHSYNGTNQRQWNVKSNVKYIKSINNGKLDFETEILSKSDQYNEYVMTRLRIQKGINLDEIHEKFGQPYLEYLILQAQEHLDKDHLEIFDNHLKITPQFKFLSDGIAADLFKIDFVAK